MNTQKTDWNVYYTKPKSRFSAFTQRRTLKYLLKEIELADLGNDIRVLESQTSHIKNKLKHLKIKHKLAFI